MSTLSHGSDLRLAPALGPLVFATAAPPRKAITTISEQGFEAVQLDATLAGLRPRELDATARRDLIATTKRSGLLIAGMDFFIPAEHYSDPQHVDRAVESAIAACTLAGDLGRVPVSLNLPITKADPTLVAAIIDGADALGVPLAIHDESAFDDLLTWLADQSSPSVGLGMDPAALLIRDRDPSAAVQSNASALRVARLSDASKGQADGGRQVISAGSLDTMSYRISIDLAPNRVGPVVLDLRGLTAPLAAMRTAQASWDNAAISL